jgi:hypothetical protein
MPSWELRTCTHSGLVSCCGGPDPVYILGCITFPCHVVPLDLPMWWGRVPFSVWPGGVARVRRLHAVEEGTPNSGYRQNPSGTKF